MSKLLAQIQADFQEYVLGPGIDEMDAAPAIADAIAQQFGLSVGDRLGIYHNAYRARLREALSEAFGKTHSYLGDAMFEQLTDDYVRQHPSQVRNLRWYGHSFPTFLAGAIEDHPVVAELARFEWALGVAFDAGDAPALSAEGLRALSPEQWETIAFVLHPSIQFLPMHWNAVAIWLALDKEQEPPDAAMTAEPAHWLVWRKALQPHFRSLDRYEILALQGLQEGRSFSQVCEAAVEMGGDRDIAPHIAGWLQNWMKDEVLSEIRR